AEALKLTAQDLLKLEVVDQIISEPVGGAHRDYDSVAVNLGAALRRALEEISKIPADELLEKRYRKFRRLGIFSESKTVTASPRLRHDPHGDAVPQIRPFQSTRRSIKRSGTRTAHSCCRAPEALARSIAGKSANRLSRLLEST